MIFSKLYRFLGSINVSQILTLLSFGFVILGNVLIFSIYEREQDIRDNNKLLAKDLGLQGTITIAIISLSASILIALTAFLFMGASFIHSLPLLLIASGMLLIISFPGFFSKRKFYGIITDLLLLLFLLVLIG
jgi:4-hydroxybenzoate polyprenyltransferase